MKIIAARYMKLKQYANPARLEILVDRIPAPYEMVYEDQWDEDEAGCLYFAENDGYVSFFYHNPANQRGFGGSLFALHMKNGTIKEIVGPWSSRSEVMNAAGFTPSMEVSITDRPEAFDKGYTFMSGHITQALLDEYLADNRENGIPYVEK